MAKPLMTLTENAARRVQDLLKARSKPALGVRVTLKTKGCSGLAYGLEYVDEPQSTDELVEDKGVRLYLDAKAVLFLLGTEMDFEEDTLKSGFLFRNPNAKGQCGCGESFHV